MFYDCPLAGNTRCLFEIFLLFKSVTSAVTVDNVGVLKQLFMILATLDTKIRNLSNMFLALQKFDLLEDKLELDYHSENLMTKRGVGFNREGICIKLEIVPGFHLYITEINSKHQSSFQSFSATCKHHYKITRQVNGQFVAYAPCLKCHVHNRLPGFRRVYVGIGSLV